MAVTSNKAPGTATAGAGWTYATTVVAALASDDGDELFNTLAQTVSSTIKATNFGFTASDIPSGSTIDNLTMVMRRYCGYGGQYVQDNSIRWTKNNTATVGTDIDSNDLWSTVEETKTFSGLGGVSWADTDIVSNSNFGIWIVCEGNFVDAEASIDQVYVNVTYTLPAATFIPKVVMFGLGLLATVLPNTSNFLKKLLFQRTVCKIPQTVEIGV